MADWAAGTRLVVDAISFGYNDEASPPDLATITLSYRTQLPSGRLVPHDFIFACPAGATSRNAKQQLTAAIAAVVAAEGVDQ